MDLLPLKRFLGYKVEIKIKTTQMHRFNEVESKFYVLRQYQTVSLFRRE